MPDSIAEALFDGVITVTPDDAPDTSADSEPAVPHADDKEVWVQLMRDLSTESWNEAIQASRAAEGEGWSLDLSETTWYDFNFSNRDLRGINFCGARMEHCHFRYCDMEDTKFDSTSYVYGSQFRFAKLRGSNLRVAGAIDMASGLADAFDFTPPLRDVTEEVAKHFLAEAIADEESFLHEGLKELRDDGFRLFWDDGKLKFYLNYEMQRYRDLCKEGACECPVDHCCTGECSCCACYDNRCDCERDHDDAENEPTDEWYLATIVGHIEFVWNSSIGLIGNVVMNRRSQHPHVSTSGNICWGDAEMPRSIRPIDYFIVMMGWVGQHNPSDPYREITSDLPRIR